MLTDYGNQAAFIGYYFLQKFTYAIIDTATNVDVRDAVKNEGGDDWNENAADFIESFRERKQLTRSIRGAYCGGKSKGGGLIEISEHLGQVRLKRHLDSQGHKVRH